MRLFLIIVVLVTCFSPAVWSQQKVQSEQQRRERNQKTEAGTGGESIVIVNNGIKPEQSTSTQQKNTSQPSPYQWTPYLTNGELVLSVITAIYVLISFFTLLAIKRQTKISQNTLVLAQRPRIVVRAFYFSEPRGVGGAYLAPKRIEAGSMCSGQFYIQNGGGTSAYIQEIWSSTYISKTLPMKRPYEGESGSQEKKTLKPGESTFYLFGRTDEGPIDEETAVAVSERRKFFHVLGWIGYTDDLGIYRITAFCRKYDPAIDRFVPVDDPDYEYTD